MGSEPSAACPYTTRNGSSGYRISRLTRALQPVADKDSAIGSSGLSILETWMLQSISKDCFKPNGPERRETTGRSCEDLPTYVTSDSPGN